MPGSRTETSSTYSTLEFHVQEQGGPDGSYGFFGALVLYHEKAQNLAIILRQVVRASAACEVPTEASFCFTSMSTCQGCRIHGLGSDFVNLKPVTRRRTSMIMANL